LRRQRGSRIYVWSSETNGGYPDKKFEQEWLNLLFRHPEKQWAFIAREIFDYSPKFADFIKKRRLEEKKQNSTYVGLSRSGRAIDTTSRVSTPDRIGQRDASQMISLVNSEFLEICRRIKGEETHFDIQEMDGVFDNEIRRKLLAWPHKTGIKSRRWSKVWFKRADN
jgi:hypothetical protein